MTLLTILLIIVLAVGAGMIVLYNTLVQRRQLVSNGWADIDVQLKRRANLVPSLVETVKAYAAHERQLFEDVTEKRNAALSAGDDPAARGSAEAALATPVKKLVAVAEDYPDLKASDNFLALQRELAETEDTIEMARRFYNGAVRQLNISVSSFPNNLVATMLGFKEAAYFEIDSADRAVPSAALSGETS